MRYFDHNASSPLCEAAREAWLRAQVDFPGNPSSPHRVGARAEVAIQEARGELALRMGCEAREIVFVSGATEANNTIIAHLAGSSDGEAWVSSVEHPCVLAAVRRYFPGRYRLIPVSAQGVVELDWLAEGLRSKRPAFVGVMAANNETGVLQPWRAVHALCHAHGIPVFCDAAQWFGKLPAQGLGVMDFVSGCAHKFGGPQGVGFLKAVTPVRPLLVGGPQEDEQRAGTENVAGILAMMAALVDREGRGGQGTERDRFEDMLLEGLPGVEILGKGADRLWNTAAAVMPEIDCRQRWVVKLDRLGIAASTGSACASGKEAASHVVQALGVPEGKAGRVLRFSSGWETGGQDWDALAEAVREAWRQLRP